MTLHHLRAVLGAQQSQIRQRAVQVTLVHVVPREGHRHVEIVHHVREPAGHEQHLPGTQVHVPPPSVRKERMRPAGTRPVDGPGFGPRSGFGWIFPLVALALRSAPGFVHDVQVRERGV